MTSVQGISFEIRPSATLTRVLLLLNGLAGGAALASGLPVLAAWPLAAATFLYGLAQVRRYRRPTLRCVGWAADGVWSVTDCHGRVAVAELIRARVVGSAVVLSLRWRRGAGHVALLSDNIPAHELRLLRARLGPARR